MTELFDVVVIGAGPAGSTAAGELARRGRQVLLLEKLRLPAHRVCGEFVSPDGAEMLRALGLGDELLRLATPVIDAVVVTGEDGSRWCERLPSPALGVSRFTLDLLLFERAVRSGAIGVLGATVGDVRARADGGMEVSYSVGGEAASARARCVIAAFGKGGGLRHNGGSGVDVTSSGLVAFKTHCRGEGPSRSCELHAFRGGYCGLSPVEGERVNLCVQVRADELRSVGGSFAALAEHMRRNRTLGAMLDRLERCFEPLAIAGYRNGPRDPTALVAGAPLLRIGDAGAMIAPLTGDGMAMALASGSMVAPMVDEYLGSGRNYASLCARYRRAWRREFGGRLRLGRALDRVLMRPRLTGWGLRVLAAAAPIGRAVIRRTRGASLKV